VEDPFSTWWYDHAWPTARLRTFSRGQVVELALSYARGRASRQAHKVSHAVVARSRKRASSPSSPLAGAAYRCGGCAVLSLPSCLCCIAGGALEEAGQQSILTIGRSCLLLWWLCRVVPAVMVVLHRCRYALCCSVAHPGRGRRP
jgi:hypothetical protein